MNAEKEYEVAQATVVRVWAQLQDALARRDKAAQRLADIRAGRVEET